MFCLKCGEAIPDNSVTCPKCGSNINEATNIENSERTVAYASQKSINSECDVLNKNLQKEYIPRKKQRYIGIAMCVLACVLFIFAIKNITNNKYKFYVENYDAYVDGYNDNSNTATQYSGGLFKSGYNQIASSYKDMADDAKKEIWSYRIKALGFLSVGVVCIVIGIKKVKKRTLEGNIMSLIKCPGCGKNISNTSESYNYCGYCGYKFEKSEERVEKSNDIPQKQKKSKKKIVISAGLILCIVVLIISISLIINRPKGLQANAEKHIDELEERIGDVDVFAVLCFSRIGYGDKEVSYKYLIEYKQNGKEDFAVYYDEFEGEEKSYYVGNGYDGGETNDDGQIPFNNLQALSAHKDYLEYLIGEGDQKVITEEDAKNNNAEGIIVLKTK